ncbi:hypothetical protein C2G38_2162739 [Gigaspora rosea]|uniref:Serine-threonine/tyrosine-protein kinase catalytic domain-containing protein n=1 Tax=Gigaspora rosea TaxID=44941 RepID=A0A397VXK9_9GLOM|nr:hypothetical protein C2G38_2162739 [Gigaspora rosea]
MIVLEVSDTAVNECEWQHNLEIEDNSKKILTENEYQLSWIPYDDFTKIEKIGKGGFATVYYAIWYDKRQNATIPVALKLLHKSNNYYEEFIKLKAYCDIGLKDPIFKLLEIIYLS